MPRRVRQPKTPRRIGISTPIGVTERRVNSSATVGTEPGGIQRYSLDTKTLTYTDLPHT